MVQVLSRNTELLVLCNHHEFPLCNVKPLHLFDVYSPPFSEEHNQITVPESLGPKKPD